MSGLAEAGGGEWQAWGPPDCITLRSDIKNAWEHAGRPRGKFCGVQVQGDGDSIRRYRVKLLNHGEDPSSDPRNWPPPCPGFPDQIENAWSDGGRPHGTTCVVMIECVNPISGYWVVCHPSPG
jgi:hypothetical protein